MIGFIYLRENIGYCQTTTYRRVPNLSRIRSLKLTTKLSQLQANNELHSKLIELKSYILSNQDLTRMYLTLLPAYGRDYKSKKATYY